MTNAWGIFVIVFLNGFGLVAIPRKVFNYSNRDLRIKKLEYQAAEINEENDEYEEETKNCAGKLRALKERLILNENNDLSKKVEIMWNYLVETDEKFKSFEPNIKEVEFAKNVKADELPMLYKTLKTSCHEYIRSKK